MSCLGVHFGLTDEFEHRLLSAATDKDRIGLVKAVIEPTLFGAEWAAESDKAWDGIHRCMTDGTYRYQDCGRPRGKLIVGGSPLILNTDADLIFHVDRGLVAQVAQDIEQINNAEFAHAYNTLITDQNCDWFEQHGPEDLEYTWEYFQAVRSFVKRCAASNRPFIFTADQ